MKQQMKRTISVLTAGVLLAGSISGCSSAPKDPAANTPGNTTPPTNTTAPGTVAAPSLDAYPITVEELGSGTVKWAEAATKDGWMEVTNEGGTTLGYSPDSGIKLIQVEGLAFKDLNKNDQLDAYEDWRLDNESRSTDIGSKLTVEDVAGLMLFSGHQFNISPEVNEDQAAFLDMGVRAVLSAASSSPTSDQAKWANAMQTYTEGLGLGIPVNFSTDPRSVGVSKWPGNLALAATFDPAIALEQGKQLSTEYRALGIGTLLGPQIDLASEPRWVRYSGTFGEDPALSRDMTEASASGYQSTYDASGADLGWGLNSVNAMIKHWPGDGAAQSGRESHDSTGQFAVYPGDQFETALIPFVDGGFTLTSSTGRATAIMSSYSIAFSEGDEYGELVGSAFSDYKLQLLRNYGFDGVICTDWGVMDGTGWGVEEMPAGERAYKAIMAGTDQFGGLNDPTAVMEGYEMMIDELGEEDALLRMQKSGARLLRNYFNVGLFDNAYISVANAKSVVGSDEAVAAGHEAQIKSIVMLKNDGAIQAAAAEKPTVYVPLVYTPASNSRFGATAATADLPVDRKTLDKHYNVITDTVNATLTGPADADGNPTVAYADIIRATPAELAECTTALVFVTGPKNVASGFMGGGYDNDTASYIPISLQYGPYTADGPNVRSESLAGPMVEVEVDSAYGAQKVMQKQNIAYYGQSAKISNASNLDTILYATTNMPESAKIIVAINASGPMIVSEFESQVDAILIGFDVANSVLLDIAAGVAEPSGLLPMQMPADMDTVEANFEDVPRDMTCYEDAQGNTYDFAYGMNWAGVISDERTAKYNVEPLVSPVAQPVE